MSAGILLAVLLAVFHLNPPLPGPDENPKERIFGWSGLVRAM